MTRKDDDAATFYEAEENRRTSGSGARRARGARLTSHVPVRFEADLIGSVKVFADEDGMTVSSWIRLIVAREVRVRSARQTSTTPAVLVTFEMVSGDVPSTQTGTDSSFAVTA